MLGFTPARKGRSIQVPEKGVWYVRPLGALNGSQLDRLAAVLKSQQVPGVDLSDHWEITNESLYHLKSLNTLQFLDISRTKISDNGLKTLGSLSQLKVVILPQGISDAGVLALKPLQNLEELNLDRGLVTDAGLSTLAVFPKLQRLDLSGTRISDAGISSLNKLPKLTRLVLNSDITDASAPHLQKLKTLREIDISQTYIHDEGLRALSKLPYLETIYLNKYVGDVGVERLSASKSLRTLDLSGTTITDEAARSLGRMKQLQELSLGQTEVGNASLVALGKLPNLKMLELSDTHVAGSGLAPLADAKKLEIISLSWQTLTREDLEGMSRLRQLKAIILNGVPLPEATMAQLRKLSPFEAVDGFERARLKRQQSSIGDLGLGAPVATPQSPSSRFSSYLPESPKQRGGAKPIVPAGTSVKSSPTVLKPASRWGFMNRKTQSPVTVPAAEPSLAEPATPGRIASKPTTQSAQGSASSRLIDASRAASGVSPASELPASRSVSPELAHEAARAPQHDAPQADYLVRMITLQSNPTKGGGFSGLSGMKQLGSPMGRAGLNEITSGSAKGIVHQEDRPENFIGEININATR